MTWPLIKYKSSSEVVDQHMEPGVVGWGGGVCSLGLLDRLKGILWAVDSVLPEVLRTSLASLRVFGLRALVWNPGGRDPK